MEWKYYKVCWVRCKLCGDVLEHVNRSKNELSTMLTCSCGQVSLDPSPLFHRIIGDEGTYEDLSEEWEE